MIWKRLPRRHSLGFSFQLKFVDIVDVEIGATGVVIIIGNDRKLVACSWQILQSDIEGLVAIIQGVHFVGHKCGSQ
jgi:hypothetical protein